MAKGYEREKVFYIRLCAKDKETLYVTHQQPHLDFINAKYFNTFDEARIYGGIQKHYNWSKGYNVVIGEVWIEIDGFDLGTIV